MRQKRVKSYRKVMGLYTSSVFGFREPYQMLVDSEFVNACATQKIELAARAKDVLQGNVKLMITQCCIQALYDLGPSGEAAVTLAKRLERRMCNHFKARPELECLSTMAGSENKHRYVFGTQSDELRKKLRAVPGTPIVYINRSVVLLEAPSSQTIKRKEQIEKARMHASTAELATLRGKPEGPDKSILLEGEEDGPVASTSAAALDEHEEDVAVEAPLKKKKKAKGPKGPNPLSVKKKKAGPAPAKARAPSAAAGSARGTKRARDEPVATPAGADAKEGEGKKRKRKRKAGKNAADGGGGVVEAAEGS